MNDTNWERRQSLKPANEIRAEMNLIRLAYQQRRNENAYRQTRMIGFSMIALILTFLALLIFTIRAI